MSMGVYVYEYVYVYMCMGVYVYVFVCTYVWMCACGFLTYYTPYHHNHLTGDFSSDLLLYRSIIIFLVFVLTNFDLMCMFLTALHSLT